MNPVTLLLILWLFIVIIILTLSIINSFSILQTAKGLDKLSSGDPPPPTVLHKIFNNWDIVITVCLILVYFVSILFRADIYPNTFFIIISTLLVLAISAVVIILRRIVYRPHPSPSPPNPSPSPPNPSPSPSP